METVEQVLVLELVLMAHWKREQIQFDI